MSSKYASGIGTRIHSIKPAKLRKISLSVRFFKNHAYDITMYSGNFQQVQKSRLQDKFLVAAFLINSLKHLEHHVRIH